MLHDDITRYARKKSAAIIGYAMILRHYALIVAEEGYIELRLRDISAT